jgi:PAS domain S-box-containing protein
VFELAFIASLVYLEQQAENASSREKHYANIISRVHELVRTTYDCGSAVLSYGASRSASSLDRFNRLVAHIPAVLQQLKSSTSDEPSISKDINELEDKCQRGITLMKRARVSIDENEVYSLTAGSQFIIFFNLSMSDFMNQAYKLVSSLDHLRESFPLKEQHARAQLYWCLIIGLSANVLVSIALSAYFSKDITNRIAKLIENACLLEQGKPMQRSMAGGDEIARLDVVFHRVAAALKEASRQEKAILENALAVMCLLDSQLRITQINSACSTIWGYDANDLIEKSITKLIHEEDIRQASDLFKQAQQHTGFAAAIVTRVLRNDKRVVWMNWSVNWSSEEQSFFCVAQDITTKQELDQAKTDLMNMVSHDLRGPLMSNQFILESLQNGTYGELTDDGKSLVGQAKDGLKRLIALLNDLLDFQKIDSSKLELHIQQISLASCVNDAIKMLQGLAKKKTIALDSSELKDCTIAADQGRLVQVLSNLIGNAIKFSPEQSSVSISSIVENNCVTVLVSDSAPKIPEHSREVIFEKFRQIKTAEVPNKMSTGLGLSICKSIVDAHHGTIGVKDHESGGNVFWFRIPIKQKVEA